MSSESLHDGMDKTCIQQATSFPVVMQHKAMPTENIFERGIAHSADSNPMCSIPPLLLHQSIQEAGKENSNITTHQQTHLGTLDCCFMRTILPGQI
jgi:hypothetical protein